MFVHISPPPDALIWLSNRWEVSTVVFSVIAVIASITMTLIANLWRVRDVCGGYPLPSTSKCPFSTTINGDTCLLGSSVQPTTGIQRYLYFVPSYSPTCDMSLAISVVTVLFCLILCLVAVKGKVSNVSLFATEYHNGVAMTFVTGLVVFLNLAIASVATEGYNLICSTLERRTCESLTEYNPITINCLPLYVNITKCSELSATSVIGGLRVTVGVGWFLFVDLLLLLLMTMIALYVAYKHRLQDMFLKSKQKPITSPNQRSETFVTFVSSPSTNLQSYQAPERDNKSSPQTSLSRLVEEKYNLPTGNSTTGGYRSLSQQIPLRPLTSTASPPPNYTPIPDQMSYEPEMTELRSFPLQKATVSSSTDI